MKRENSHKDKGTKKKNLFLINPSCLCVLVAKKTKGG